MSTDTQSEKAKETAKEKVENLYRRFLNKKRYTFTNETAKSIVAFLMKHEGYSQTPYKDNDGVMRNGYGTPGNLTLPNGKEGKEIAQKKLCERIDTAVKELIGYIQNANIPESDYAWILSPENEKIFACLVLLHYQLGMTRLLGFKNMWLHLGFFDPTSAALEIIDSKAGATYLNRFRELAILMGKEKFPEWALR